jgi:hypothetical protein
MHLQFNFEVWQKNSRKQKNNEIYFKNSKLGQILEKSFK